MQTKLKQNTVDILSEKSNVNRIFLMNVLLIGIINLLFYENKIIMFGAISFQIIILGYLFLKRESVKYIMYLVAYVSVSLEMDVLIDAEHWYGFVKTEFLGVRLPIVMIIPGFILLFNHMGKIKENIKYYDLSKKIILLLLFAYGSATFMGIINIVNNDNNIRELQGYLFSYVSLVYFYGVTLAFIVIIFLLLSINRDNINVVKTYLKNLLLVLAIVSIFAFLFNIKGQYSEYSYLLVSGSCIYLPMLIINSFYSDNNIEKYVYAAIGIVSSFIVTVFASSGKMIIICGFIPIILLLKKLDLSYVSKKRVLLIISVGCVGIAVLLGVITVFLEGRGTIFVEKLQQVTQLFKVWDSNYLQNLPLSPRCRILEIINIGYEYQQVPIQVLFGKGFLGSFTDHTGMLTYIGEAFTNAQWESGVFYLPHESLARFFLMNGLIGVYIIYFVTKTCLVNMKRSPWLIAGIVWFMFFYGYSINLLFIGAVMFVMGIIDVDESKSREYEVLVLDFLFEDGHRYYCNCFVNALNKETSTFVVSRENYYDFEEDLNHKKIVVKTKPVPGKNIFESRYNILYNMYQNIKVIRNYRFKKVLVFGYEGITFFFLRKVLEKYGELYLVQHHQLDELRLSRFKNFLFNLYKNKVKHIVMENVVKKSVGREYNIPQENIYTFPVPLLIGTEYIEKKDEKLSKEKIVLALSNSNDETFVDEICRHEKEKKFFKNNGYQLVIRTRINREQIEGIRFVTQFISTEEYNSLYENAHIILMPFPKNYVNRSSGTIVDAISMKKRVLCSRILLTEYYAEQYPHLCKIYDNVEDVIMMIESFDELYHMEEYKECLALHDEKYQLKCVQKLLDRR